MRINLITLLLAFGAMLAGNIVSTAQESKKGVRIVARESERRVDVEVDGQAFTSYIWPESLKKPVLYPLRTGEGTSVTRGFPLAPRAGERVDHPHHAGLWFNYGDVNGVDFWNNSTTLSPAEQKKMGSIVHRKILAAKSGPETGELEVAGDWVMPDGQIVLTETTKFIFHRGPENYRAIDRLTTLTARDQAVQFKDNKEGLIGMRVARALEHPADKPEIYTDAQGRPTAVAKLDNTGVTGHYRTSEGKEGDAAWGTRGRWAMLSGKVEGRPVTVAILDHPRNPGHPTYWHARGYGLFAANPLGQKVFSEGREELKFSLKPRESVIFRHRILLLSDSATPAQIEEQYERFTSAVK